MSEPTIRRVGIIGLGAIGRRVLEALQTQHLPSASYAVVDRMQHPEAFTESRHLTLFSDVRSLIDWQPDLVIECAGHGAVVDAVPACLRAGIDVVIASIGALADRALREDLEQAANAGKARLILVSGAIGGLDAIRSARAAGLDEVIYIGRKPPQAWGGTPADDVFDLASIDEPTTIFRGSAAQASVLFPKNANVTAAVALSGVGFELTQVQLIADPGVHKNVHEVQARGAFGELSIRLINNPLPDNVKTSWLAALSIEEAVAKQLQALVF
ncbi:aspartate dehydrogenase [Pseudomonas sp. BIGb0408]|uniref:L-aspartate dehydrogenase n=1 Tax=Phytopseudomonas flavescens TaxID=29435 RepID=A0A7Z0BNU5_9GAMM|nr:MULTISPECIES: aspartate dehydrogenase [Pseudomonas]MCW2293215.1 aspartate dehydrogenase [Pseudomonas sp. BIGb0408]NYH72214.1 aspartate dehydrogenase [Pseudomonas flavescens]